MKLLFKSEFYKIKKACIKIRKELGNGFLEKIYENALTIELEKAGFHVQQQNEILVRYDNKIIGTFYPDIIVDNKIIIEMKCVSNISDFHKAQVLNYLKITGYELGLIINFPNNKKGFNIDRIPNFIEVNK